jgi:Flp pilus assembly protein TadD
MKKVILLSCIILLSACSGTGGVGNVDGKKFLSGLDGPEVTGIDQSTLDLIKTAEEFGEFARMAQYYKQLIDRNPDNADYWLGFADSLRRSRQYGAALSAYDKAEEKGALKAAILEGKGLANLEIGEFDEAGLLLSEVMELEPKRWRTLNSLGILFASKNLFDEAQQYFKAALQYSKDNPSILNNVGLIFAINKQYKAAENVLIRGVKLSPSKSPKRKHIELNLSLVYGITGNIEKAEELASRHLSGPALKNNLGFYAYLSKDEALAKSYLNMALSENPYYYERAWKNLNTIMRNRQPYLDQLPGNADSVKVTRQSPLP